MTTLIIVVLALLVLNTFLVFQLLRRASTESGSERAVREELRAGRTEATETSRHLREEVERRLDKLREVLDQQMVRLQESNEKRLDEMRRTVDEKLEGTLEKRLTEAFKRVSGHLEAVQQGLGEMKQLATGVGDLKRVLTNVKTRGTWGEVQLGSLLEQILTSEQYDRNVKVKIDSNEAVEFAIVLPGQGESSDSRLWLPIDAKFPQEDYVRLQTAAENADADGVKDAKNGLARSIRSGAQDISEKYLDSPQTTDFGIMFLPTEGLYAEVLQYPGLVEEVQQKYRVVVAGPTTLAAILNSLQMGFRTLAIEKRSSEVWRILSEVKIEFEKFGSVLEKLRRHLQMATKTVDETDTRARQMKRKLKDVEERPLGETTQGTLKLTGGPGESVE